jgi:MoaA/NifB/PqqE/SkfB family radical SAM enzyme
VALPLFQKRRPERIPVEPDAFALFRLGEACDRECPMCPNSGRPEAHFFDEAELLRRVAFLDERGVRGVFVTGGEPTIHPAFWTVVDALRARGINWRVNTHGRRFAERDFTERARAAALGLAIVSFHSHLVAVDRVLFGTSERGHFDTVAGIERLLEAGVSIYINCVVTALNAPELPDFVRFCAARFGTGYSIKFSFPLGFGKGAAWRGAHLRYADIRRPLDDARAAADAAGIPVLFDAFPFCVLGDAGSTNRGRSGCGETLYLEDLRGEELLSITHIEAELSVYGTQCMRCRALERCPGVGKIYAERYGVGELEPF